RPHRRAAGRTPDASGRFPRHHDAAGGHLPHDRAQALDSPSRPAVHVPAADGRAGPVDLRGELRQRAGGQGAGVRRCGLIAVLAAATAISTCSKPDTAPPATTPAPAAPAAASASNAGRIVGKMQAGGAAVVVLEAK